MERVKEDEYGQYTLSMCENRTMKPVRTILTRGREGMKEDDGRSESN
jgi:hypothetical protein